MYGNRVVFTMEKFGVISATMVFTNGEITASRGVINLLPCKKQWRKFTRATKYILIYRGEWMCFEHEK